MPKKDRKPPVEVTCDRCGQQTTDKSLRYHRIYSCFPKSAPK